ncbi:MAG: hypothetical protein K2Y56_11585 [Methylobacterium sp.]|uniref:hypothetical protein n=1 Tax=Methylobacterium sp. TaxID=409 RepID=UPI001D9AE9EF|nr:hypothetical protein [Methylobacterium sp.]MBX9719286.1 hypothetical protein [Microbacteriaceae bacterium]MBX9932162.1 hypothetical protein [Methylobacterium sp.]
MRPDPFPPTIVDTVSPQLPPIIEWWRVALLFASLTAIVWWAHILVTPASAETVGYRLEIEACRDDACRPILPSDDLWSGKFACENHAAVIEQAGRDLPLERIGLARGTWIIKARCAPIDGMPDA